MTLLVVQINLDQYDQCMNPVLINAKEACARLSVRPQTLYAYVSRGYLTAHPDPRDPRRRLYGEGEVDALMDRKQAGRSRPAIAARAIEWGDPVLETHISTVDKGRLLYRGREAVDWSASASIEDTAALLCDVTKWPAGGQSLASTGEPASAIARGIAYFAQAVAAAPPSFGRSRQALVNDGAMLLSGLSASILGQSTEVPVHEKAAEAWNLSPEEAQKVRQALVLCADHELKASTFAVRVAASTGTSLPAALLAGLAALAGPIHGGATLRTMAMLKDARAAPNAQDHFAARLARGEPIWGFGHPLYPDGDIRSAAMLEALPEDAEVVALLDLASDVCGQAPNLDAGLAALALHLGLSEDNAFSVFLLGRTAGWIAHAIEQVESGKLIRPRAQYVGKI